MGSRGVYANKMSPAMDRSLSWISGCRFAWSKRRSSHEYVSDEMCTLLGMPLDSIAMARFTVLPNRWYLGSLTPTTPATNGPVWMPTRMRMSAFASRRSSGIYSSISSAAAAHRSAWSGIVAGQPATEKYASPMISTLWMPYLVAIMSNLLYITLRKPTSCPGEICASQTQRRQPTASAAKAAAATTLTEARTLEEKFVKPRMSVNKIVAISK